MATKKTFIGVALLSLSIVLIAAAPASAQGIKVETPETDGFQNMTNSIANGSSGNGTNAMANETASVIKDITKLMEDITSLVEEINSVLKEMSA